MQAEIKKQLALKKWTYKELANATNYKLDTIYQFMSENGRKTENVARKMSEILDIDFRAFCKATKSA